MSEALTTSQQAMKTEAGTPLVRVEDLVVRFPVKTRKGRQYVVPVNGVQFHINHGEVLALVGESGSGKTTIGKALVRTLEPNAGQVVVDGRDVTHMSGHELKLYRRVAQMIFQDPFGSLNPVKTAFQHLAFPLHRHSGRRGHQLEEEIDNLLEQVGLTPVRDMREKYPHELSGGQRQRLAIARALAVRPKLMIADEPISMLDVSIRAGILKLLRQLQEDLGLSFLYITHDLASARYFGDRIMVLYGGRVMETAYSADLIRDPQHPYTKLLLAATPGSSMSGKLPETSNEPPNLLEGTPGCPFAPRCPMATDICRTDVPPLRDTAGQHAVACHHA